MGYVNDTEMNKAGAIVLDALKANEGKPIQWNDIAVDDSESELPVVSLVVAVDVLQEHDWIDCDWRKDDEGVQSPYDIHFTDKGRKFFVDDGREFKFQAVDL